MRCTTLLLFAALGATDAFVNQVPSVVPRAGSTHLFSDEAEQTEGVVAPSWPAFEPTGLTVADVKKSVKRINQGNFNDTLDKLQPFLVNEAGQTFYNKVMRRLAFRSKELGMELPTNYAKEAKWNQARRAKQDEFIQAKEEERLAAEAAAATEEKEEEESSPVEEEAAPVEEPELVGA
jgi:hypothetical protein